MGDSTAAAVPDAIRRYFAGVNAEDWDDFRGIWHEDAEVEVVGGMSFRGVDELMAYYPRVLANFPVHHDDPYAIHVAGDVVTVEIAFQGETADGVEAAWEAVDVFTLEDGRVRRLTTWYDMGLVVDLLRQPGRPERRLRNAVEHAASASPFYRDRLASLGVDAEAVAADLTRLPPTRPDDLAADPGRFVAVAPKEVRQVVAGAHGAVPLARGDVEEETRLWALALELAGVGAGAVVLALVPQPALLDAAARVRARLATPASGEPDDQARAWAGLGVDAVVGPADRVAAVQAHGAELGLELSAKVVEAVARPELGVVAAVCPQGSTHVLADGHHVEIADAAGAPVPRGETGELLVTPLGRRALPLLRYATGEAAAWSDAPCACGSELPCLARVPAVVA